MKRLLVLLPCTAAVCAGCYARLLHSGPAWLAGWPAAAAGSANATPTAAFQLFISPPLAHRGVPSPRFAGRTLSLAGQWCCHPSAQLSSLPHWLGATRLPGQQGQPVRRVA
jgi:hypothetical protein